MSDAALSILYHQADVGAAQLLAAAMALAHPRLTMLLSLRADFYSEALQLSPTLSRLLEGNVIHLQPPTPVELAQVMVKPARLVTLAFEPGLVERLSADLAESPHPLLLLQGVLVELWRRHQGGLLRHAFYDDFGGAQGTVARRAAFSRVDHPICPNLPYEN